MFNLFTRKSSAPVVVAKATATPAAEDYVLNEKQQEKFNALEADAQGFVKIGDVTHGLMNMQSQYITRYMDGSNPSIPVLVDGLRVNVDSISHHEYTIHKDDVLEFVARVKANRR